MIQNKVVYFCVHLPIWIICTGVVFCSQNETWKPTCTLVVVNEYDGIDQLKRLINYQFLHQQNTTKQNWSTVPTVIICVQDCMLTCFGCSISYRSKIRNGKKCTLKKLIIKKYKIESSIFWRIIGGKSPSERKGSLGKKLLLWWVTFFVELKIR